MEIHDEEAETAFWAAVGFDDGDISLVRANISSGVIAESITTGRTAIAASALDDPRWSDRESVRKNAISCVLSSGVSSRPYSCPGMAPDSAPTGAKPPRTCSSRRRPGSNISSRLPTAPSCR